MRLVQGVAGSETAIRRPAGGRAGLAAGRRRLDPPGRPRRGVRPRSATRDLLADVVAQGRRRGGAVRRHPRRRLARGARSRPARPGQLGTAALENPDWVRSAIARHGERIAVGLDVRGTTLAARGWTAEGGELLADAGPAGRRRLRPLRRHRRAPDGTLTGPNLDLLRDVCARTSGAGGGQRRRVHPGRPAGHRGARPALGVEGAIVGKALYAGAFTAGGSPGGRSPAMTVAVRVIPCLDVDAGRVVKGVNFAELRDAGDPVELAARLRRRGRRRADVPGHHRVVSGDRDTTYDVVRRTAEQVFIPLTVGGGRAQRGGRRPAAAGRGGQGRREHRRDRPAGAARPRSPSGSAARCWCCRWTPPLPGRGEPGQRLRGDHARRPRSAPGSTRSSWARRAAELGAGEILLNSMDADGTKARLRPGADPRWCGPW